MRTITYRDALREAIREEMQRDERVFIMGEDIAGYGGTYAVSKGLFEEFGEKRVRDTPLAEEVITGAAIGAALGGLHPILELMTIDFSLLASDQIVNQAAKFRYMFGGQPEIPIVVRMPGGGGAQRGAQHSQMLESWYAHIPGLKVVMPATPYDAKGMLKSAVRDPNPVLFIEHELLYNVKGEVPDEGIEYTVPLNRGEVKREGEHVTIITFSRMLHVTLQAAEDLANEGIQAEVIDLRSIRPIDIDLILDSVKKTNRVVIAEEGWKYYGTGQGLAALIYEFAFDYMDAPIQHVNSADVPMPYSKVLERAALPKKSDVVNADKANIEIESFASGVLRKILVPEGASAPIGAGIALIGAPDEPLPDSLSGNGSMKIAVTKEMEKGATTSEGNGQTLSEAKGDIRGKQADLSQQASQPTSVQSPTVAGSQGRVFISPIARRIAEEHQLDYSRVEGTGPNGRIIKLDIEAALAQKQETVAPSPAQLPILEAEPASLEAGEATEIPLTAMRRTIAKRLSQSMQTAPHFYVTSVIDTGKLADLRRQINEFAQKEPEPVKVSFNDLIVKAVALALVHMPQVNVSFAEDRLIQKKQVHIGMAVALEQGLIVPVIHNVDRLGILDIARESKRLTE